MRECQGVGAHSYTPRYVNAPCPVCNAPARPLRPTYADVKGGGGVKGYVAAMVGK